MRIPHPIPYQGSKRGLAAAILAYLPKETGKLIEPFAGSAALSLAAAQSERAETFLINDVNSPLIALWDKIIHRPEQISEQYQLLWEAQQGQEQTYYYFVRKQFNQTQEPHFLLYLLARCVKASVRYNSQGEFNQSPDNRRCGTQPSTMRQNIWRASCLLRRRTALMQGNYRSTFDTVENQDVIYMDPPYQGVCAKRNPRYSQHVDFDDFMDSLTFLNKRGVSYIVSYDGRTGEKRFGKPLPASLELTRLEINAGRSTQATLLGHSDHTYEALYLSAALVSRLSKIVRVQPKRVTTLPLFA